MEIASNQRDFDTWAATGHFSAFVPGNYLFKIDTTLSMSFAVSRGRVRYSSDDIASKSHKAVIRIVDLLEADAISDGARSIWTGLMPKNDGWVLAPTATDLYSGLPGIAMFLAYAGSTLNEPRASRLANSALESILQALDAERLPKRGIGAFSGLGGIVYALSHIGTLWGRNDLLGRAGDITHQFPELIDEDEELDIITGSAGCIASCISQHACQPSDYLLVLIERCGNKLLDCAQPSDGGIGWCRKVTIS